jgi:hypothetical protein
MRAAQVNGAAPTRRHAPKISGKGQTAPADKAKVTLPTPEGQGETRGHRSIVAQIRMQHRRLTFAMKMRIKMDNGLGAFVRSQLGWSPNKSESDNAKIKARAQKILTFGAKAMVAQDPHTKSTRAKKLAAEVIAFAKTEPMFDLFYDQISLTARARKAFDGAEDECNDALAELVKQLPVWPWAESLKGFGAKSLANVVGVAGDLSNYPDKSKLWKRLGLAPITKDGVTLAPAEWRKRGGLSGDDWLDAGYSPKRRSLVWNIGASIIKAGGLYRKLYDDRKKFEKAKAKVAGFKIAPAAKIPKKRASEFVSEGQIHRRAQRYMEKQFIRDLWKIWRQAIAPVPARAKSVAASSGRRSKPSVRAAIAA